MNYSMKLTSLFMVLLLAVACIEEPTMDANDIEQRSLAAWIDKYRPDLKDNYQTEGGYYVDLIDEGCQDSLPVTGKDVWLWYNFTGRDLQGNIQETRDYKRAIQLGTYTPYTHYVPAYRFSGKESTTMMEGTYLATFNKLHIDGREYEARYGTEMVLYLPSTVVASTGSSNGGYEGQFSLDASKPMVVHMKLFGHVSNPVAYEGECVDTFADANGGICTEHVKESEEEPATPSRRRVTRLEEDGEEVDTRPLEFYDGRWHQPIDTLQQLYVNYSYSPKNTTFKFDVLGADTLKYEGEGRYSKGSVYSSDVEARINEVLLERFGEGITRDEVLTTDSLKSKNAAKVWYIGRFIDGFIFDTNIDEVKEIVFGEVKSKGEVISFEMSKPVDNPYILSWNYSIPTLRVGQWAAILSVSTYGYGISGQVGKHTSTTTGNNEAAYNDYLNYMNYMSYMNNYYGYGYGNSMYNYGYYGYNPYYYGYASSEDTSTTVTTTSTEIPAYSPLLFQIFVE
ncbi:MAG: hypothetical protein U0L61_02040 [Alistipes sp.]|nr:hypothetical protein [Alistipes sp.]